MCSSVWGEQLGYESKIFLETRSFYYKFKQETRFQSIEKAQKNLSDQQKRLEGCDLCKVSHGLDNDATPGDSEVLISQNTYFVLLKLLNNVTNCVPYSLLYLNAL